MSQAISRSRSFAFKQQNGRCYYCGCHTWLENISEFAAVHGITKTDAQRFKCTAEHLKARQDGGMNVRANLVASCWFCNSRRHRRSRPPSPETHRQRIQERLRRGKWHPSQLHHMLD